MQALPRAANDANAAAMAAAGQLTPVPGMFAARERPRERSRERSPSELPASPAVAGPRGAAGYV
jgi:hypothetical protein